MGKAKLRLIYVAESPVFPHQPIWQEKWKSNCWAFRRRASNHRLLTEINRCLSFIHTERAPSALWSYALHFVTGESFWGGCENCHLTT